MGNGARFHDFHFDGIKKWYDIPERLSLAYNNNYLTFQFVGITIQSPKKVKYQYKLEGLDENWSALTNRSEAQYSNLPHGKYTFKVKAMNGDGYWSNEFNYSFAIRPPWWETWWFRILSIIAMITVVYAIVQRHSYNLKKQNIQLEEKVVNRTKELKQSLDHLKATQAQLVHQEKMASLGELTAGIAHEIQNPLNFVNNFSEVNAELIQELKAELKAGNNEDAISIANDIADNEQKISHHGKRADGIVKSMLQHSRSSSGKKEPTDINALADEYLKLAYHGLRAKNSSFNATMQTNFDQNIGKINIIPQDIGRVILNLITNAFYAVTEKKKQRADSYEPTVIVTTKRLVSPFGGESKIEIIVGDNGNGIPEKVIGKIFQPFFTTKPTGGGTGLGLSLSYDIVKAHGGELKVETKENEGTEFTIQLPA